MNNINDSDLLTAPTPPAISTIRPRLDNSVFAARRAEFMRRLGSGAAIFRSAPEAVRSNDSHYRYRQDSDFYYLTGFTEPDAVLLLLPQHPEHQYILFVRPRNPEREVWDGRRAGPEGAVRDFGATLSFSIEQLDEKLPGYLEAVDSIYYRFGTDSAFDTKVFDLLKRFRFFRQRNGHGPYALIDPAEILHELRLFKSAEEIELMRHSANIAADAHTAAMRAVRPGMYEFEVEAVIEQHFRRNGSLAPAYNSIVGAGPNATILHYNENNRQIGDGELLLVDAGVEYEYYASDITRTYPANGRFTKPQREIYQIVLAAQLAAIEQARPGVAFTDVHQRALDVIVDGLLRLGLLTEERQKVMDETLYTKFFMHRTSHWLGTDVHDVGKYKVDNQPRRLEAGMVLTIEPGIYIGDLADVPAEYRNIGVRIEDDVLITEQGHEVLTHRAPKEIADLEAIICQGVDQSISSKGGSL